MGRLSPPAPDKPAHALMLTEGKGVVLHSLNVNVSVVNIAFYDFCGFRSVTVNSVYKLRFFTFICCYTLDNVVIMISFA